MALKKFWIMAYRDLMRNRRRTFFTLLAVALGLALLIVMNGWIAGIMEDSLQNSIRLKSGHVQIRASTYEEKKLSLEWKDLLENADGWAARANQMAEVKVAAPVLWAGGMLNATDETAGVQIYGIETTSSLYDPIRESLVGGEFLSPDDRNGILIGKRLADSLGLGIGDKVNLAVVNADGQADQGNFTIRGLYTTGIIGYDDSAVFMPLEKAQAFTQTDGHASAVVILLHQQEDADKVAAALMQPGVEALTWEDLNALFLQTVQTGMSYYLLMDGIVMLVVVVIIINTLLMAVFERTREMGILAALGMKGRQILGMIVFEACLLGLAGIVLGIVIGSAGVGYLAVYGIDASAAATAASNITISSTLHARFEPGGIASLSFWTLVIILLASLYPAWIAARMEPVQALHTT